MSPISTWCIKSCTPHFKLFKCGFLWTVCLRQILAWWNSSSSQGEKSMHQAIERAPSCPNTGLRACLCFLVGRKQDPMAARLMMRCNMLGTEENWTRDCGSLPKSVWVRPAEPVFLTLWCHRFYRLRKTVSSRFPVSQQACYIDFEDNQELNDQQFIHNSPWNIELASPGFLFEEKGLI